MAESIGIYIHVPFCIRKCAYCDFPSFVAGENDIDSYFNALESEIDRETETAGRITDTIYIGGGTPSAVPPCHIPALLNTLAKKYNIADNAEISMEMNPGTVDKEAARVYRASGVNRVSLGCQSFNEKSLKRIGRIHGEDEIYRSYDILRESGFENINLDLISSLPGEKASDMERSLKKAIGLSPQHISVYSLILEPGTPLYESHKKGEIQDLPDEEVQEKTDVMIKTLLKENNYIRYEISNYALPGYECKHNLRYWERKEYRGFGLSAASLIGKRRFTNSPSMVYITNANPNNPGQNNPTQALSENRLLSVKEEMEEFMFLGLRKTEGVSADAFREYFGKDIREVYSEQLDKQIKSGFMEYNNGRYFYNDKGLDVSNILLADFIG